MTCDRSWISLSIGLCTTPSSLMYVTTITLTATHSVDAGKGTIACFVRLGDSPRGINDLLQDNERYLLPPASEDSPQTNSTSTTGSFLNVEGGQRIKRPYDWDRVYKIREVSNFAKKVKNECHIEKFEECIENFEVCPARTSVSNIYIEQLARRQNLYSRGHYSRK